MGYSAHGTRRDTCFGKKFFGFFKVCKMPLRDIIKKPEQLPLKKLRNVTASDLKRL